MRKPISPLRRMRRTRTLNQTQLAKLVGITQESLSKMERGLITPRPDVQNHLAAILGSTPAELFPQPDADTVTV
jgi:transcriptional regulator with XRE-family HTH domain